MAPETKKRWIPALLMFLPLIGALVSYAVTNAERNAIQDQRLLRHEEQMQEMKDLIKSNSAILTQLSQTQVKMAVIQQLLAEDHKYKGPND